MKNAVFVVLCGVLLFGSFFTGCEKKEPEPISVEMVIANGDEPLSLDPSQINGVLEQRIYNALFEGLVGYNPRTAKAVPGVAENWTFSGDGTILTFSIREGITWSDGTPITAQQIVDSWLHHLNPATASPYAYMIGMIVKGAADYNESDGKPEDVAIRAVNARTFEVKLISNVPYALDMMAHFAFSPLPMHAIQKHGSNWIKPGNIVSNGPFVLLEHIPNNRIVVTPNDKYWNKANIFIKKITFLPIEDENTVYQAYRNNEIDWVTNPPMALINELVLRKDFQRSAQLGIYYYYINTRHPVLKDPRIRKALSMGFNREELIDSVLRGGELPALGFSPPINNYKPASGSGFNVAAARQLLTEAGYPGGQGLPPMEILYNTSERHKIIAEYMQEQWRVNLGVNVVLKNMEWATYLTERMTDRMQICRAGWIADYMDPQNFLELLMTESGNNAGHYSDAEYDRLLKQAASLPDGPTRDAVLRQAEEILIVRDQAVIPIYYYVAQNLIDRDKWDGWYSNPLDVHPYVGMKRK